MNGTGRSCRGTLRFRSLAVLGLAGIGLAMAGCSGGGATGSPPSTRRPPRLTPLRNRRPSRTGWPRPTRCGPATTSRAVDQVTAGQMRTLYLSEAAAGEPAQERLPGGIPADRPVDHDPLSHRRPDRLRGLRRHRCLRSRVVRAVRGHGVRADRRPVEAGHGRQPRRRQLRLAGVVHAGDAAGGAGRARAGQLHL